MSKLNHHHFLSTVDLRLGIYLLIVFLTNLAEVSSDPGLFLMDDLLEEQLNIRSQADLDREQGRIQCLQGHHESEDKFRMRLQLCQKGNVSITCSMGETSNNCFKDIEAYKASALLTQNEIKCLIDANTTEWKFIQFVVQAKMLKNLNEDGSRGLSGHKVLERQRGKCTLGYSCHNRYLTDVNIDCFAFNYDENDKATSNATTISKKWVAPNKYNGPIEFGLNVNISYKAFNVDVTSAYISEFQGDMNVPKLDS